MMKFDFWKKNLYQLRYAERRLPSLVHKATLRPVNVHENKNYMS